MIAHRAKHADLEAEKTNGANHKVFSGCAGGRQHGCHVIYPQGEEEKETQQMTPDVYRLIRQDKQTFDTQSGRKVGPVAVGDVGVVFEGYRDLFIGVEADAAGYQDRPVLVAAQLDVVRTLQQLLMHGSQAPARPRLPGEGALPLAPPPRSRRR